MERKYLLSARAERSSNLVRSFWYGKYLQTIPNEALLSCKQTLSLSQSLEAQCAAEHSERREAAPTSSSLEINTTPSSSEVSIGYCVVPVEVQRALQCMGSCSSSLSPAVHELVVGSMCQVAGAVGGIPCSVIRCDDCTLEWSEVGKLLGDGRRSCLPYCVVCVCVCVCVRVCTCIYVIYLSACNVFHMQSESSIYSYA